MANFDEQSHIYCPLITNYVTAFLHKKNTTYAAASVGI